MTLKKEPRYQLKSTIRLCHPAKASASLCATVSKRRGVGSPENLSPLIRWRLGVCEAQRQPFIWPRTRDPLSFSNKMINNNNPPREREEGGRRGREEGGGGGDTEWGVLWSAMFSVPQAHFLLSSPLTVNPLKIPSLHFIATWQFVWHHLQTPALPNTRGPHWLVHVLHNYSGFIIPEVYTSFTYFFLSGREADMGLKTNTPNWDTADPISPQGRE